MTYTSYVMITAVVAQDVKAPLFSSVESILAMTDQRWGPSLSCT